MKTFNLQSKTWQQVDPSRSESEFRVHHLAFLTATRHIIREHGYLNVPAYEVWLDPERYIPAFA